MSLSRNVGLAAAAFVNVATLIYSSLNDEKESVETKTKKRALLILNPIPFNDLQQNLRCVSKYIGENITINSATAKGILWNTNLNKKVLWDKDRKIASKVFESFEIESGKVYGKNENEHSCDRELVAIADTGIVELIADPVPQLLEMRKKDCEAVTKIFRSVHIHEYNNDLDYAYEIEPLTVKYFDPYQGIKCTLMAQSVYVLNGIAYAVNQHGHTETISMAIEYCIVSSVLQFLTAYLLAVYPISLLNIVPYVITRCFKILWSFFNVDFSVNLSLSLPIMILLGIVMLALLSTVINTSCNITKIKDRLSDFEVLRNLATDADMTNAFLKKQNFQALLHTVVGTIPCQYSCPVGAMHEFLGYKIITLHSRFSESGLHFIFVVVFGIPVR